MALIYATANFLLESHEKPEIDRLEGGHVKISPKIAVKDRTQLTPALAKELMRFTMVAGEAMERGMKKSGVAIGRINYQENGNWKHTLHVHLYCRARDATMQKFGEPIVPGHNAAYKPLSQEDIAHVKAEIELLFKEDRFSPDAWDFAF